MLLYEIRAYYKKRRLNCIREICGLNVCVQSHIFFGRGGGGGEGGRGLGNDLNIVYFPSLSLSLSL